MHNASSYIEHCLRSLYHQDLDEQEFEVIIIDDGSTDNSVDLVERFRGSHDNIHLFLEKNIGAYATRNKLLKLATGDYIYCIDADDYLAHNQLNRLLGMALAEKLEMMCFDTQVTSSEDSFLSNQPIPAEFTPEIVKGQEFIKNYPNHRVEIWWYLIRRDYLRQHGFVFDNNQYNADVIFTLKVLMNAKRLAYAPFSVHRYYQSPNSLMRHADPYKNKRLLVALFSMVKDLNTYVNSISSSMKGVDKGIKDILIKRRDQFSFFFLVKLSGAGHDINSLKRRVRALKHMNVYPIQSYIGSKKSLKYQLLNFVINNEFMLFPLARINWLIKNLIRSS